MSPESKEIVSIIENRPRGDQTPSMEHSSHGDPAVMRRPQKFWRCTRKKKLHQGRRLCTATAANQRQEKKNTAQVRLVSPNVLILSVGFDSVTESAKIKVGYYLIWVWTFDLGELKSPSSGFKLFGLGMVHISGGEYILFDS